MLLRDQITSGAKTVLLVLLAASGLIFIIACSNVANLILARSVRREGELAIRAALGASTGALRRTLLAESLLLCTAGAALGLLIADPMVSILAGYASRFSSPRARSDGGLQHPVGGSGAGDRCRGASGIRAAPAVGGVVERNGAVEQQCSHHRRYEPPAAHLRGDADRCVVYPAGRLEHSHQDPVHAAVAADRFRHAAGARAERASRVVRKNSRRDHQLLPRGDPAHRRAARRGSRCPRYAGAVA